MAKVFPIDLPNSNNRMYDCGSNKYWYYHAASFPNDPPLLYEEIINQANDEIKVWDPYFNVQGSIGDHSIFSSIKKDITLKILTTKKHMHQSYLKDVYSAFKFLLPKSKNIRFGLRVFNRADSTQSDWLFHDRFLLVDNSDAYIIGSSIRWHIMPQESTGIFKVDDPETIQFIYSIFEEYWKNATKNQVPLQLLHT